MGDGGVDLVRAPSATLEVSLFHGNSGTDGDGLNNVAGIDATVNIYRCVFSNNLASASHPSFSSNKWGY